MNCEIPQALLNVPASEIPEATMEQVHAHLKLCPACNRAWRMKRLLGTTLRANPVPPLPEGFAERMLARVFAVDAQRRRRRTTVSLGIAAVLVLGLALGFILNRSLIPAPGYAVRDGNLILQSEHPTTVGVALNAGSRLENVRFTIDLPAGMHVAGQPGLRHLSWNGELRRGQNLLKLPVVAHAGTDGLITTELSHGTEYRVFTLRVRAVKPVPLPSRLWHGLNQVLSL